MSTVEPQMLKGVLALLLLRLCAEREDYGYSLVQRLRAGGLVDAAEGSVYPALARLESRGLIEPRLVREGRGPGRRYYSPSPAGHDEMTRLQQSWETVGAVVRATATPGLATPDGVGLVHTGPGSAPVPIRGG